MIEAGFDILQSLGHETVPGTAGGLDHAWVSFSNEVVPR